MELNQLPGNYDAAKLGPQKRETEFASPEAKLAFDAENLVAKARKFLEPEGAEKASSDQVTDTIKTMVGTHRNDFTKAVEGTDQTLEGAVMSKLYSEEELARLAQARSREGVRAEYETFIDKAELSEPDALKLKEMMSEANYLIAVETAEEMKASKIPTFEQIAKELMTYTPERLQEICEIMEKPEIVIESDKSFTDNVQAMNENPHYTATDGRPQEDTYVNSESDSPYRNLNKPGKVKARVVDGVPHPKQLQRVSAILYERRVHVTAKFAAKQMKNIGPTAMAALLQQSIKRAKAAGDNSLIVDNWEKWATENIPGTITLLDPDELTESTLVAYSNFNSRIRQANFYAYLPYNENDDARGRASVQVLEI